MSPAFEAIRASLLGIVLLLAVIGPPAWWYWHGRRPGERRQKRGWAILFGILLLTFYLKPTPGAWIGWMASMVQFICAGWIIAWGVKGSPRSTQQP